MKKVILCALLAAAVMCGATALNAQMQDSTGQAGGPPHRMPMSPDQRLQHMTKMLNLTADQQAKIKPVLESESQQMEALHQDTSLSQQDRHSKMQSIRETSDSQIKSILTADQQAKWAQMQSRRMQPPPGEGQMGSPAPGAPPQ